MPEPARREALGGLQGVPEGLVVAMALRGIGHGRLLSVGIGVAGPQRAGGMVLAAGAMLFVIGHSVIPASHRGGRPGLTSSGLVAGFVLMMVLDTALSAG